MPPPPPPPPSMNYGSANEIKVVPFTPKVTSANPAVAAASQLQDLITSMQAEGWNYVSVSSLQTVVAPTGCGSNKQPQLINFQLVIFNRK